MTCIHDTPMTEPCEKCCGTQGRLEKLGTCHKCEELKNLLKAEPNVCSKCNSFLGLLDEVECPNCEKIYKLTNQVKDTCKRAETVEAELSDLKTSQKEVEILKLMDHYRKQEMEASEKVFESDLNLLTTQKELLVKCAEIAEATAQRYRGELEFLETVATGENQVDVFDDTEALHWIATYIREQALTEPTKLQPGEQDPRD